MHKLLRSFFVIILFFTSTRAISQNTFSLKLSDAALELTKQKVTYDPGYYKIAYPDGDLPANKGVCTDVVIRAYRKLGIDLQKELHEDMVDNFSKYPKIPIASSKNGKYISRTAEFNRLNVRY